MKKGKLVEIETVEELNSFNDEYVYDLEMEDGSHTFIANDILVHNTDSIFVGFNPSLKHSEWKNIYFNKEYLESLDKKFVILSSDKLGFEINNPNLVDIKITDHFRKIENSLKELKYDIIIIDGYFIKDKKIDMFIENGVLEEEKIYWNWVRETDFIQGMDKFRVEDYFKKCLEKHANSYGVENKQDFELERISESIINITKKKYIQHILSEDGISYQRLAYFFPKGVELVRSSTPVFAREKIIEIIKYIFSNPNTFNIQELLSLVKKLRKEFELADIDEIAMQSSVSNYENKMLNDRELPLEYIKGSHFAVKASGYYNYLLHQHKEEQKKYEFIKSGMKIKYYVCKNKSINGMFAYIRGSYPVEFAPEVDYDEQFKRSILSPINSIIEPLGMPEITKRLSIVMDIFSSKNFN